MSRYQAVDRNHHAAKCWQRYSTYSFTAGDAIATLVAQELPKAHISLSIAFIKEADDAFTLAAVQGLKPGQNLLVAADGRWLAAYIPAVYRGYPFRVATAEDGRQVLCIDEDSGLVGDGGGGEPFFNEDGTPATAITDVLNFLTQVEANREVTARICAALHRHDLVQPWPIKVRTDEGEQAIDGLFRIDETALNALPAADFIELRDIGALTVAYCQLLSMQHLQVLGQLAQAHAQAETGHGLKTTPNGELDLEFLNQGGSINFGNLA